MPWEKTAPPEWNRHTVKAAKLDAKADRALRRGDIIRAVELGERADRIARKGGWV
jgi:hypothetical protein